MAALPFYGKTATLTVVFQGRPIAHEVQDALVMISYLLIPMDWIVVQRNLTIERGVDNQQTTLIYVFYVE